MINNKSINVIRIAYHHASWNSLASGDSIEASKARDAQIIDYFRNNLHPQEQLDFIQVTGVSFNGSTIEVKENIVALTNERVFFIWCYVQNGKLTLKKGGLFDIKVSSIKLNNIDSISYSIETSIRKKKYANSERKYTVKSSNKNDDDNLCFVVDEDNYDLFDKQVERINNRIREIKESSSNNKSMLDELERLSGLYREKLISQEEFEKAKKLLLG